MAKIGFLMCVLLVPVINQTPVERLSDWGAARMREIDSPPAASGSAEPNFTAGAGGVYLSWIEPVAEKRHALRFSSRVRDGWSAPATIAEGSNWFVNWADFPSMAALADGRLAAHWLVKSATATFAYDVNVALSPDRGKTWSQPIKPHRDGTQTEHGFVSLVPWPDGTLGVAWLDGRDFASKEGGHGGHGPASAQMMLRYSTVDKRGALSDDILLDARVCECCQTSAALTSEGVVVVYRDRSDKEVRDISVVRWVKGRWTEPRTVNEDGWQIEGCPVNGPAVAAVGRRVAVAWFTAANNKPSVNVSFSDDAGATFGKPVRVDEGSPVGRVDIVMLEKGLAVVSWIERAGSGAEIRVRQVGAFGARSESIVVAPTTAARAAGFPRMERSGDEVILAWTDAGPPSRVRVATFRAPAQ